MKPLIIINLLLFLLPMASQSLMAEVNTSCQLSVSISEIDVEEGGQVCVTVFKSSEGFPTESDKAILSECQLISKKQSQFELNIPYGVYAVSVLHDANKNNEMDSNFFGIPKEGVGASNNAKGSFGPPSFKDASFKVDQSCQGQKIKMAYL